MNTTEINRAMRRVPTYRGTFCSDNMPGTTGLIIANTDPCGRPGTHWIAIYISPDRQRGEYFDSFGRLPIARLANYLNRHCDRWYYCENQLQSVASSYCGVYCMLYCIHRSRGVDLENFIACFSNDTGFNDVIARHMLTKLGFQ